MPVLRFLWHFGSGFVSTSDTMTCDTLDVWGHQTGNAELTIKANVTYLNMHTTSDLTLHGMSSLLGVHHTGEGFLHCEDLLADYAWTHSTASGDEYISAKSNLWATIDWEGNIFYTGNPSTELTGSGKGKLIQR